MMNYDELLAKNTRRNRFVVALDRRRDTKSGGAGPKKAVKFSPLAEKVVILGGQAKKSQVKLNKSI